MSAAQLDTWSADDVILVSSIEGAEVTEVRITIDTGDAQTTTTLSARQAQALAAKLIEVAANPARHSTSCYLEAVNNLADDHFWVCRSGCRTRAPVRRVIPGAMGATED